MRFWSPLLLFASIVSFIPVIPSTVRAQSVAESSGQPNPDRIVAGANLGKRTRSSNMNPYGVSYSDCASDMTLHFTVIVSGFASDTQLAVWGGLKGTDCSLDASRMGTPACWPLVPSPNAGLSSESAMAAAIDVRVQDLVGYQAAPPANGLYSALGIEACSAQGSFAAVPMSIWFIPTDGSNHVVSGSSVWAYDLSTDLVGPPAPSVRPLGVGDALLTVNWNANNDGDTVGYDLYRDPPPAVLGSISPDAQPSQLDCPEGGDAADSGCVRIVFGGGAPSAAACMSAVLSQGGDAGVSPDAAAESSSGSGGGLSDISPAYLVPGDTPDDTVGGASSESFIMTGLNNGTWYGVAVAAVDLSGNVGPLSSQVCDFPAPTSDFFDRYRQDGGRAGCVVDGRGSGEAAILAGASAISVVLWRRRRRPRRATADPVPRYSSAWRLRRCGPAPPS
jgi:hypothetical protein